MVTANVACTFEPTAIDPKLSPGGETAICAGVRPEPVREFVLFPALAVVNTILLEKTLALTGVKETTILVLPDAGISNALAETIVNGPPLTAAMPLLTAIPPGLLRVKAA